MLLQIALEKILSETQPGRHNELREACQEALEKIKQEKTSRRTSMAEIDPTKTELTDKSSADKYWHAFKLGLSNPAAKVVETTLDNLQKLVAHHVLRGSSYLQKSNSNARVIDDLVDSVCACFTGVKTDEAVQLQVIKVLLTCVTSPTCEVHGQSLLKAIQTCFNVFLFSKNVVNQVTAKASLTQMVNIVFQKMEKFAVTLTKEVPNDKEENSDVNKESESIPTGEPGKYGFCLVCHKKADYYCAQTKDPVCSKECKLKNLERLEKEEKNRQQNSNSNQAKEKEKPEEKIYDQQGYDSILKKDVQIVFQKLCQLSKTAEDDSAPPEYSNPANEIRGRILALELLLSVLTNPGPVFRTHESLTILVKKDLCIPLSKNGVSANVTIFELSLSIFLVLLSSFKAPLRNEIQVLFKDIFLKILDSSNGNFQQKAMVMQGLFKICSNPQTLVDFYLNYDCDVNSSDLFESMVNEVSKTTRLQPKGVENVDVQLLKKIKLRGLKCIVAIINSLLEWTKEVPKESAEVNQDSKPKKDQKTEGDDIFIPGKNPLLSVSISSNLNQELGSASDSPSQFEEMKSRKMVLKQGMEKFNDKPSKGIAFLRDAGFLDQSPLEVAKFLLTTPGLDKAAIGDFIGGEKEENIKVMHAFVDMFQFQKMKFTDALRGFLQSFRLPGEAQKIDRIMEKFADRYCENNPDIFANADTAYTLAFSTIMLNTDLWSPQIKVKMSKQEFLKNNRGINNGADLDSSILEEIYEDIKSKEIVLEEEQITGLSKAAAGGQISEKQRNELSKREVDQLTRKLRSLLETGSANNFVYHSATQSEHVKPMFSCSWMPLLASISVLFEESEDDEVIQLCLGGFQGAVRISCHFQMQTEREAFAQSLSKFTILSNVSEMTAKNVNAIRTLLTVALENSNYLNESWIYVFQCISRLERLQLISNTSSNSSDLSTPEVKPSQMYMPNILNDEQAKSSLEALIREFQSQAMLIAIDKVFALSGSLDAKAIVYFFQTLCAVSLEEVNEPGAPRMYSMQKIIEIAYYNMKRIRLEWTPIWQVLQPYFNTIGCHNSKVATFAVDSLRQMSMKFLEKDELARYHTQNEFLKPFEHIMKWNKSFAIREYTLKSIEQMIRARARNIKSGWKSIFLVLSRAASETNYELVSSSFNLLQIVLNEYFDHMSGAFVDFISCLVEFAFSKTSEEISLSSIHLMQECTKKLFKEFELENKNFIIDDFYLRWFPILSGLSRIVIDCDTLTTRMKALETLFSLLKASGTGFDSTYWKTVFRTVLGPIFEDLTDSEVRKHEIPSTVCIQALKLKVELFSSFYTYFSTNSFLEGLLELILSFIIQKNENLAKTGVICFQQLILKNLEIINESDWNLFIKYLGQAFEKTAPIALFINKEERKSPTPQVRVSIPVHLELVKSIKDITLTVSEEQLAMIPREHRYKILKCLYESYELSHRFNEDYELRQLLVQVGFVDRLPNLNQQETTSISSYLLFLFRLYRIFGKSDSELEPLLVKHSSAVLEEFVNFLSDTSKYQREVALWSPIVVSIITSLIELDWTDESGIKKYVPKYFSLLTSMLMIEAPNVRMSLKSFMSKVSETFFNIPVSK